MSGFVPLPGSDRAEIPDAMPAGDIDPAQRIEVTLILRRRAELPAGTYGLSSDQLAETYGADPADIARVREVLTGYGLTVTSAHQASRRMKVAGSIADLSHAFGTTLSMVSSRHPGADHQVRHRYRTGPLMVPAELAGTVTAVLGLDDRPAARAHFRPSASGSGTATFTAVQVARAYEFPPGTDGSGQTIAIIELGGGFSTADLATYFSGLGIDQPAVTAVSVDGAANSPGQSDDAEVMLDIEVAGAVAPRASQFVYFAPNTEQGFIDAVSDAAHASPVPTTISISWGQSEDTWTAQARDAMDAAFADAVALAVTVTAAAGDNGSGDGVADGRPHVDFPASSPHVLACGGTSLVVTGGVITSETVWNDALSGGGSGATGGGVSDVFAQPAWQSHAGVPPHVPAGTTGAAGSAGNAASTGAPAGGPWRGVPDVAGNADPATGYQVIVDGQAQVYGGTSAVAPLWAALIARLAQGASKRLGPLPPALYRGIAPGTEVPGFRDITSGSNGAYSAARGWDPCTGLGSPNGAALLTRLTAIIGIDDVS
jgi:kumamolisin